MRRSVLTHELKRVKDEFSQILSFHDRAEHALARLLGGVGREGEPIAEDAAGLAGAEVRVEQHLYPVLDDLLSDWVSIASVPYDGIRVAGTQWSPASHKVKDFLTRNQVPYRWLDVEQALVVEFLGVGAGDGQVALHGVLVDLDQPTGGARAAAFPEVLQDRESLVVGQAGVFQDGPLPLGEAGLTGAAVDHADPPALATVTAEDEIPSAPEAGVGAVGILATELFER